MRRIVMIALAVALLGGCQGDEEDEMDREARAEARAVEARAHIDDLVDRIGGTGVTVVGDDTFECDPQDPDEGLLTNYTVRFTVDEGAVERLRGEVAADLKAKGWSVRRGERNDDLGVESVSFQKDSFTMGSMISDSGNATAGGSGGCVK